MSTTQSAGQRMTRISSSIYGEYQYKSTKGECIITDFSMDGLAIATRQLFVVGDLLRIRASLPRSSIRIDIWCVVRNVQGGKVGLQFEEISYEQKEQLREYVYSILDTAKKGKTEAIAPQD